MSYLNDYADIQKNIDESRFSETAEYLVNHFSYVNDVNPNVLLTNNGYRTQTTQTYYVTF